MKFRSEIIFSTYSEAVRVSSSGKVFDIKNNEISIDEQLIQTKIAELEASEPMRLLRIERDKLLAATDWRFRIDQEPSQAWYEYCQALRDLPQEIENGNIPAPTLDENGMLVFEHWPERIQ